MGHIAARYRMLWGPRAKGDFGRCLSLSLAAAHYLRIGTVIHGLFISPFTVKDGLFALQKRSQYASSDEEAIKEKDPRYK